MDDDFKLPEVINISVMSEHAADALARIRQAGFEPVSEELGDGKVTYSFATPPEERLSALLRAIPKTYYWHRGFIVGNRPLGETD